MQQTRKLILAHLKEHGQATVEELAAMLGLTTVTVRHHLDVLRRDELVTPPLIRHRATPGRPVYVYALTDKASAYFPNNYGELAAKFVEELKAGAALPVINVIFEGVARRMAAEAPQPVPGETMTARLERAMGFLNQRGYVARWETTAEGYLFHTCNCPYEALSASNAELCGMDITLVGSLLGVIPERVSRVVDGAETCSYLIRERNPTAE